MAEARTQPSAASVADFLAAIEDPQRRADCEVVSRLMQQVTGRAPRLWGSQIVGFGKYLLTYANGKTGEWPLIGFSPRKGDLTLYLMPGFDEQKELLARLGRHKTGKSCLYLKSLAGIDQAVLREMLERSVAAMAATRIE